MDVDVLRCPTSNSNKNNVELGVNYKDRFCFTTTITSAMVEDGSAAKSISDLLEQLDQYDINFKIE